MSLETNFGDETAVGVRFDRFKFSEDEQNKRKRIVFISKKVLKEAVHYQDGYGYMRCLTPSNEHCPACAKGMRPTDRFGTVVLEYYTDMDGNISKPFGYTVKAFVFGNGKGNGTFSILHGIHKTIGDKMYQQDFVVSCLNPKFQTLNFLPTGDCGLINLATTNKEAFAEIKEDYTKKMAEMDLVRVVAPYVAPEIMQKVVDGEITRKAAPKNQGAPASQPSTSTASTPATATSAATPEVNDAKAEEAKKLMNSISL
jgi:hypothetical protein